MPVSFEMQKTGETGTLSVLGPERLPEVLALHNETRAMLPEEQKMFILPQTPSYFEKFLAQNGSGLMLGATVNGKLVAQLVLMGPITIEDAISKRAVTRNEITWHHVSPMDTIFAVKSVTVHPDFRGNGLSQRLLQAALELPAMDAADHVFAQISAANMRSWELFLENGFGIVGAGIDPGDNKERFILQRPAQGFSFDMAPSADDVDPVGDFPAIVRLTQRGALIGRLDETGPKAHGQRRLAFSASAELSASQPLAGAGIA